MKFLVLCICLLVATYALPDSDTVIPEAYAESPETSFVQDFAGEAWLRGKATVGTGVQPKQNVHHIHAQHVKKKIEDLNKAHANVPKSTQTKLAAVSALAATVAMAQSDPTSKHDHSAIKETLEEALKGLETDITTGHENDKKYIAKLHKDSTEDVTKANEDGLGEVEKQKKAWCPANVDKVEAEEKLEKDKKTLEDLFLATANMKKTCDLNWDDPKTTVESAFDAVTGAKNSYITAKDEYDKAVAAVSEKGKLHEVAKGAFDDAIVSEPTSANQVCTTAKSTYDGAKAAVSENTKTRKHSKELVEYLKCFIEKMLDGTATTGEHDTCKTANVDTSDQDITMSDMSACETVEQLKAKWGPVSWTPTETTCASIGSGTGTTPPPPPPPPAPVWKPGYGDPYPRAPDKNGVTSAFTDPGNGYYGPAGTGDCVAKCYNADGTVQFHHGTPKYCGLPHVSVHAKIGEVVNKCDDMPQCLGFKMTMFGGSKGAEHYVKRKEYWVMYFSSSTGLAPIGMGSGAVKAGSNQYTTQKAVADPTEIVANTGHGPCWVKNRPWPQK